MIAMLERSIESVIIGVITGVIILLIEYWSGFFAKIGDDPHSNRFAVLISRLIRKWHYILYLPFLAIVALVWVSNFAYFRVISPRFINTVVIVASLFITLVITVVSIYQRFSRGPRFLHALLGPARRLIWLWLLLFLFTAYSAMASPRYLIVVLPVSHNDQASIAIVQRIEQYLQRVGRSDIAVRELPCAGPCQLPDSMFIDSRVLLVISGEVEQDKSGTTTFELTVAANCRRDPSPIEKKYTEDLDCTYSGKFPFDDGVDTQYLETYLPILLLNAILSTEGREIVTMNLVKQAISALNNSYQLQNKELVWELHEKLFYDLLYNTPKLTQKERIDSAGEVRARAALLPNIDDRLTYLTARWYEESGSIYSDNYERAIAKYQEIVYRQPDSDFALARLASVSARLGRYADAVCYISEALKLNPNNQYRLRLASFLETLGVPAIPNENGQASQTLEEIRQQIQEVAINKSDASSIREFFSLAENSLHNRRYEEALAYTRRILNSSNLTPAERAGAYYLQGRIRNAQSNFEAAIDDFRRFLDLASWERFSSENLVAGYTGLGLAYRGRGYHAESAKAYQRAADLTDQPERKAALLAKSAEEWRLAWQFDTSRTLFEQAKAEFEKLDLSAFPVDVRVEYTNMIYEYSFLEHNTAERLRYYKLIVDFYSSLIDDIKQKASTDFEGCEWISRNLYNGEKRPYDYLRDYVREPAIPSFYYRQRRLALHELNELEDARSDAQLEIERLKRSAQTAVDYYNLGLSYLYIGEYQAAIDSFQQAIDRDNPGIPDDIADATDYFGQGLAYKELRSYAQAAQVLTRAIEIQSNADPIAASRYYNMLATVYRLWGIEAGDPTKLQSAVVADQMAIKLPTPNSAKASNWRGIGLSYLEWAKYDPRHYPDAIEACKKAIALDDSDNSENWLCLGKVFSGWGVASKDITKFQSAIDAYLQALKLSSPNSAAGVWFNMGIAYLEWSKLDSSRFPDAVDAYMKAIHLDNPEMTENNQDPRDIADWYMIAIIYREWAKVDQSKHVLVLESLEKALTIPIDPNDGDYHWHRHALRLRDELKGSK